MIYKAVIARPALQAVAISSVTLEIASLAMTFVI